VVLEDSILVEIHQTPAEVPAHGEGEDEEDEEEREWRQEKMRPVKDIQTAVAKEGDVDVVTQSHQPH